MNALHHLARAWVFGAAALALVACGFAPPRAPEPGAALPPMRRLATAAPEPPRRSNAEMARDFIDLSFRLESGRMVPVFTRFEGPIRARMTGAPPPTAAEDLGRLLARLRAEADLPITAVRPGEPAQITVEFLPRRTMHRLVPRAACFVALSTIWAVSYAVGLPPVGASPIPNLWGMTIATICLAQLFTGAWVDRRYDPAIVRFVTYAV
ncbi:MAG: DUF2927 domain-containing protein, partial [Albidovulum sp.]